MILALLARTASPGESLAWTPCRRSHGSRFVGRGGCSRLLLAVVLFWAAPLAAAGPKIRDRVGLDIRVAPVQEATARSRVRLVEEFSRWIVNEEGLDLEEIVRKDLPLFSRVVRAAGWRFFESSRACGEFRNLLLGLAEEFPWARGGLTGGWRVVGRWGQLEPTVPHSPLPLQALRAALTVCGVWGWTRVATCIWILYFGLLRPGECCALRRSDVMLPEEHDHPLQGLLLRIGSPKRRVGGARAEYARVDPEDIHPFFLRTVRLLEPGGMLWAASPQGLTRRFRKVLSMVLPDPESYSLGSLRTGGATHLFSRFGEDIQRLAWRGR